MSSIKSSDKVFIFADKTRNLCRLDKNTYVRKSLLFANYKAWVSKSGDSSFDVTMGCYNGAVLCELVSLYILYVLENKFGKENVG